MQVFVSLEVYLTGLCKQEERIVCSGALAILLCALLKDIGLFSQAVGRNGIPPAYELKKYPLP